MLNADGTVYGRFGTRSHRTEWYGDVSLPGLAKALQGALDLHADYPNNRSLLAGKRGDAPEVASPELYPSLKDKYTDSLNYEGEVARSCIHCHQIGEAQREFYWSQKRPIPERILFPYPHPKSLGLTLDPKERATVQSISSDSPAEASGLQAGDKILLLGGQPPLSIADVQWVLHQTDEKGGSIPMVVQRDGSELNLSLDLEPGWRQAGDISWRVTMWSLRRMVLGGMVLETEPSTSDDHDAAEEAVAIRVKRMGQNGPHGAAKRAGFQEGDLLVSYDGHDEFGSEAEVINYAINHHVIGDMVSAVVRRGEEEVSLQLPMQP
jgi:hypothetical protein